MYTRIEFWPYPFLIGLALLGMVIALLWGKRRKAYLACLAVFGLYLLLLVGVTVFPLPIPVGSEPGQSASHILSRVNLVPFDYGNLDLINPNVLKMEIFQNILMTVPFGFGLPFVSRVKGRRLLWLALGVGLGTELAQLLASLAIGGVYRSVDINDVLLNGLGVLAGYALFLGFARLYRALAWRKADRKRGLLAYVGEVVEGEVSPLSRTERPGGSPGRAHTRWPG